MTNEENLEYIEYINKLKSCGLPNADDAMQRFESTRRQNEEIFARLITGERIYTKRKNIIGFCHCEMHKGSISKALYKIHDCGGKGCFYFERTNPEYWAMIDSIAAAKKRKKETAKKLKQQAEQSDLELKMSAQNISDKLGHFIRITSVKKEDGKMKYIIYYISEWEFDDRIRFLDLADAFGYTMNAKAQLRHAKAPDGSYAVISGHSRREVFA